MASFEPGTSRVLRSARCATHAVGKKDEVGGSYAMKRLAAGAHLPTPWLFEPAKRPDEYCLGYSPASSNANTRYSFLPLRELGRVLQSRLGAHIGGVLA